MATLIISLPPLSQHILQAGQTIGQRLCSWIGVPVPPLEFLPWYKKWLVQALYLLLLGVLARVTFIEFHCSRFLVYPRDAQIPVSLQYSLPSSSLPPDPSCSHADPLSTCDIYSFPVHSERWEHLPYRTTWRLRLVYKILYLHDIQKVFSSINQVVKWGEVDGYTEIGNYNCTRGYNNYYFLFVLSQKICAYAFQQWQ